MRSLSKANTMEALISALPSHKENGYFIKFALFTISFMLTNAENQEKFVKELEGIEFLFKNIGTYGRVSGTSELAQGAIEGVMNLCSNEAYCEAISKHPNCVDPILEVMDTNNDSEKIMRPGLFILQVILRYPDNTTLEQKKLMSDFLFTQLREKTNHYPGFLVGVLDVMTRLAEVSLGSIGLNDAEGRALAGMCSQYKNDVDFVCALFKFCGVIGANSLTFLPVSSLSRISLFFFFFFFLSFLLLLFKIILLFLLQIKTEIAWLDIRLS